MVSAEFLRGYTIRPAAIPRSLAISIVATIFAYFATTFDSFYVIDRLSYVTHFNYADIILIGYWTDGIMSFLTNEPLWRLMNFGLQRVFDDPAAAIKFYVFIASFVSAYCVLSYDLRFFVLLLCFLLLPQFLKNYVAHLRQGVAISVFLLGWLGMSGKKRSLVILLTPFIHASFFFILFVILLQKQIDKLKLSTGPKLVLFFLLVTGVGIFSLTIAQQLGARQDQYELFGSVISGKAFLFWLIVFCLYLSQGTEFVQRHTLAVGMLIFYLATYLYLPVAGRIFESGLMPVLLASLSLSRVRLMVFFYLFMFYFFTQWYPRLGLDALGWIR
ncbi:EpsG family protein [Halomonas sp. TRM85114]|uniref:EpsG family protein n=1 Tax=Halomonas jincaotanensis TaxID=2810616 RepID=UPI001BD6DB9D|nr:EpsG family protein [Halomonas jincaotanensis]MBS9404046.1 EpsG family protein [Halomonas jincaotanensis]